MAIRCVKLPVAPAALARYPSGLRRGLAGNLIVGKEGRSSSKERTSQRAANSVLHQMGRRPAARPTCAHQWLLRRYSIRLHEIRGAWR